MVAHIPNKFYNIVAGEMTVLSPKSRTKQASRVTLGFYRTPDSLLVEIRKATQRWGSVSRSVASLIPMRYNKTTNKVKMDIVGDVEMTFGEDLSGALGLAQGAHVADTQHVPSLCNMFFGSSLLLV